MKFGLWLAYAPWFWTVRIKESNIRFFFFNGGWNCKFLGFADFADNEIVSICKLDQMKELNTLGEELLVPVFFLLQ
jgi:hypothetical protein